MGDGEAEGASLPLAGVTVVAIEQAVAGPFATRQLADLGARVIKVERPGSGDFARDYDETVGGMSSYFVWLNRGKESIVLDLKDDGDRAVLDQMLARCDVLVANLVPGALERLGLDPGSLRARHPCLVTCTISGYGAGGPVSAHKAYDLLIQCEAGFLSVTGTPEMPCKAGVSIADIAAGMYAMSGVLAALYERERTGKGADVTVSMLEALAEWMSQPELAARYGKSPARTGPRHASIAPYGPFPTAGEPVFVAVQNEPEWRRFCATVLERPELADDPRFVRNSDRVANSAALNATVEVAFAPLAPGEVRRRLDAAGIAHTELRSVVDLATHPQLAARRRWMEVDTPVGPVRTLRSPLTVVGQQAAQIEGCAVPALGAHSEALRREFAP